MCTGKYLGAVRTLWVQHPRFTSGIPKKHQPGKWHLITDMSFPEDRSINDSIDRKLCSLSYIIVDKIALSALTLGRGALVAKIDIKSAYRLAPVYGYDRQWLGMKWQDKICRWNAPIWPEIGRYLTRLADALEWIVEGVEWIVHDFVVIGPPDTLQWLHALDTLIRVWKQLGIPLAPDKQDGPTTSMGILIYTVKQELRLPSPREAG